jgi:hypothetical protein
MLDTTEPSVNSLLRRARAAFESRLPAAGRERAPLPNSKLERDVVGTFADAVEADDIDAVVALLTDDAWVTMPPEPWEYQGPTAIGCSCATARSGAAHRCGSCQRARTPSRRSAATSQAPKPTSRGRTRCSSSRWRASGYPRSPGSPTAASSRTSDCRGSCGRTWQLDRQAGSGGARRERPGWAEGYNVEDLKRVTTLFERHDEGLVHGPFDRYSAQTPPPTLVDHAAFSAHGLAARSLLETATAARPRKPQAQRVARNR